MNIGNTNEERREFWGTTPASILCCAGFVMGIVGALLCINHVAFLSLSLIGISLLGLGIRSDLRKGFGVRWRKANFVFHIAFLVLVVVCTVAAMVAKVVLRGE